MTGAQKELSYYGKQVPLEEIEERGQELYRQVRQLFDSPDTYRLPVRLGPEADSQTTVEQKSRSIAATVQLSDGDIFWGRGREEPHSETFFHLGHKDPKSENWIAIDQVDVFLHKEADVPSVFTRHLGAIDVYISSGSAPDDRRTRSLACSYGGILTPEGHCVQPQLINIGKHLEIQRTHDAFSFFLRALSEGRVKPR